MSIFDLMYNLTSNKSHEGGMLMSTKENKELVRQFDKSRNEVAGDTAKVRPLYEKYCAPGYIFHLVSQGDKNLEQTIQHFVMATSAFPDFNISIDDMVAEGDKVATRYTYQGTHKGPFMGPATGKHFWVKGVEIRKIMGGKFLETWDFPDTLSMMTQLGIIPGTSPKT
jgi:predicted ester cyclase